MEIPPGATSYCPPVGRISAGRISGQALRHTVRPHGTRDWLLIYTLAGSGNYRFEDGLDYKSGVDEVTLIRPDTPHGYEAGPAGWDLLFVHFQPRKEWLVWLHWPEIAPGALALKIDRTQRQRITGSMEAVITFSESSLQRSEDFALNALETTLLWCDSANPRTAAAGMDPRVERACEYLHSHLGEVFSEQALERATGLSASRTRHLFREQTGASPREFHERQKMRRAQQLLALSRQTITEIAAELGYENPFYFTLRFKKQTGQSPRDFRKSKMP